MNFLPFKLRLLAVGNSGTQIDLDKLVFLTIQIWYPKPGTKIWIVKDRPVSSQSCQVLVLDEDPLQKEFRRPPLQTAVSISLILSQSSQNPEVISDNLRPGKMLLLCSCVE